MGCGRNFVGQAFVDILRDLRLEAGVGLRELARRINKSPGYLSDVQNGRTAPPSEKIIVEMARALNMDKQRLLAAARKVDPELSQYMAQQPRVADFLRTAKERATEKNTGPG
ncbi:MAG TPA: helix-turn-helix domain-containing protein [Desulfobacteraceae bacterium]|nr:helix-turn-helix domain-containing protein [Desulfobacteraceae bacterium]